MYDDSFPSLTFNQFTANFVNTLSSSTPLISDTTEGSVALAFAEAVAGNDIALQELAYYVYNTNRLGTSSGADVDSFVADYALSRQPATFNNGIVTLYRTNSAAVLPEPLGSIVQAPVGNIQFALIPDTSLPAYDAVHAVYSFAVGQLSIDVRVQAVAPGSGSNVPVKSVSQIVSGLVGVSSIINAIPLANGTDQETDDQLKSRFQLYIKSLSKATGDAVSYAIRSVQPGLTYQLIEYKHFDGSSFAGFTVVVDDGSNHISATLLKAIFAAVFVVRAAGIAFEVSPPTNMPINVSVQVKAKAGFDSGSVVTAVTAAIGVYIDSLGVGTNVSLANLANAIGTAKIASISCVFSYTVLLINGVQSDYLMTQTQISQIGTISVVI